MGNGLSIAMFEKGKPVCVAGTVCWSLQALEHRSPCFVCVLDKLSLFEFGFDC